MRTPVSRFLTRLDARSGSLGGQAAQPDLRLSPEVGQARFGRQTVSLPISPKLTDADVERVIAAVRAVLGAP